MNQFRAEFDQTEVDMKQIEYLESKNEIIEWQILSQTNI